MIVYTNRHFNIYRVRNGYIIHNTHKKFKIGHTHIKNYNTAKYLINLSIYKSIPHNLGPRLIDSLIRINNDETYIRKLKELSNSKKNKTKNRYYNINKKH